MPREPRIYLENILYLVIAKGDEDRELFSDSEDFHAYLKSLREYKQEYGFKLFAFTLLPKSLYLLIELKNNVTISTIMHNLNSRYTKMYNSRYGKKGHLFQSRFKSILIEKEDYLLRISRYIHLLPKDSGITDDLTKYSYSSLSYYLPQDVDCLPGCEMPDMHEEIAEILSGFSKMDTDENRKKAYEGYIRSADDEEVELVQKLLHRKAYVGSKGFSEKIKSEIKNHIIEEKESRIIRKTNPGFVLAGSAIIIFLAIVAYNFYHNQSDLQEALNKTASGFETAREDLANRVTNLQGAVMEYEEEENHGLGGFAWELHLSPVQQDKKKELFKDHLQFKDGKIVSASLMARGFSPFDYTISQEKHGQMIWKTVQTNTEGLTVHWYGVVTGNKMRGVYSERPVRGENRDFSFVSVRRVKEPGRAENVIQ